MVSRQSRHGGVGGFHWQGGITGDPEQDRARWGVRAVRREVAQVIQALLL